MALSSLPLFHRVAGKRVVVLGEGPAADAKRRLVERAGGECCGEPEAHHARLAIVALEDPKAAEAAAAGLRGKGLLVNVADRPELCDFTLPSVLERGPMLVAVSSGGFSAGLTKALRLRLETLLPEGIGRLAEAFGAARERIKQRWPDPAERRRALDAAVAEGGPLDLMVEHGPDALEGWLAEGSDARPQTYDFAIASHDPDDLTLRQARLLGSADVVRHDAAIASAILARARADAERRALDDPRPDHGLTVILRGSR
jgi:uroporphyrin-III C-methyltransferase/precorrin-2 dehydrogenase/sirohydrochlorin ferrochelatase